MKPKIGETYDNFELVFSLCNLPKSKYWKEFQFTADLKAMMIALLHLQGGVWLPPL